MKKHLLGAALLSMCALSASAVPACPEPARVTQPDGSQITVRLIGDEFFNYTTTMDGYTLVRDASGAYVYAVASVDGRLVPGTVAAHEPGARGAAEKAFLASIVPGLLPQATATQQMMRRTAPQNAGPKGLFNYNKFRGLVILVSFTDCPFQYSNAHELFTDMVTKDNYDGFMSNASIPTKVPYTGSVRDYFSDQSLGLFKPQFDVVGPVSIPYSQTSPQQTSNMAAIVRAVISAADPQVDFTKYDTDGDGAVDMFYIIFAGGGSNYSGNNSNWVWPHAWNVSSYGIRADGKTIGRYACSTELYGNPVYNKIIDGIGTICHEFSHVLGLMDEYDTDYSSGGGQSRDPGDWSVMAGGSYNNYARTPVGYSLFQRYSSGFVVPQTIEAAGVYPLPDIDLNSVGYRINSPEPKEYFLIENRRKTGSKWNAYGPGHGMLVFRVDSTSTSVWSSNKVNANPAHNYYELIRATPATSGDTQGDPFPGSGNKTKLGPNTTPPFKTWNNIHNANFSLDSITENADGSMVFRVQPDNTKKKVEDFDNMTTSSRTDTNVPGAFCSWDFSNAWVASVPSGAPAGFSGKALCSIKGATITTSEIIHGSVESCSFNIYNPTSTVAYLRLQAYVGGEWTNMTSTSGLVDVSVSGGKSAIAQYNIPSLKQTRLRVLHRLGTTTAPIYIDEFSIVKSYDAGVEGSAVSAPSAMTVLRTGATLNVTGARAAIRVYDVQGRAVASAQPDADGAAAISLPVRGCYIITDGFSSAKIIF